MKILLNKIQQDLQTFLQQWRGPAPLQEACSYALLAPAKRFRPLLVHWMAKAVGRDWDASQAALAVELFHTASLIADDLPCMDNDPMRRGRPSLHEKYGEATALLASYALIAAGYECLAVNAQGRPAEVLSLAISAVSKNTGAEGATGGQYWDLMSPQEHLEEMIALKTGALFELSFVLGWLFGGGAIEKLPVVKAAAQHFGMAFQIRDDLLDQEEDERERNYALLFGEMQARERIEKEQKELQKCLELLDIKLEPALIQALSLESLQV